MTEQSDNYARNGEPMDEYAAADVARIELETCRCPRDAEGEPSPYNVNDLCEAHGEAIWRAIDNGRFWSEAWPWGEAARRPASAAGTRSQG